MRLNIAQTVREKLANKQPPVTEDEIKQCFANRTHQPLIDGRAKNRTNPLTRWFISETDYGRTLKVAYIPVNGGITIRTAYEPNAEELQIYADRAAPL